MSDPEVIADRERYAEVGRAVPRARAGARAREGVPARVERRRGRARAACRGRGPGDCASCCARPRSGSAELEEEIRLAMVERDPNDEKDVIVEVRAGTGGDEAGSVRGDLYRMLTRYAERRGFKTEPLSVADGDYTFAIRGDGAYSRLQVRGRDAPRPARPGDGVAGPHPHLDRDRRRAARGRGGRGPDRPERPPGRRLPLVRPGRPVGQHDRQRRAHHAQADRPRRLDAGREVAAPEPRQGDARAARAPATSRSWPRSRPSSRPSAARRSAPASAPRRSAPTTSARTGSPTTASTSRRGTCRRAPGRPRRVHRGARGRREAPEARGKRGRHDRGRGRRATRSRRPRTRCAPRAARRRGSTPRCSSRRPLGVDRLDARRGPRPRARAGRCAHAHGLGPAARAARAGRLHPRAQGVPPHRAGRRLARSDPAPGDRAARRGRGSSWRPQGGRVHDVGTGSGAIALAMKHERPGPARDAHPTARRSPSTSRAATPSGSASTSTFDGRGLPAGDYDLVVANLPYVRDDEWDGLAPEIRELRAARGARGGRGRARRDPRARGARRRRARCSRLSTRRARRSRCGRCSTGPRRARISAGRERVTDRPRA